MNTETIATLYPTHLKIQVVSKDDGATLEEKKIRATRENIELAKKLVDDEEHGFVDLTE